MRDHIERDHIERTAATGAGRGLRKAALFALSLAACTAIAGQIGAMESETTSRPPQAPVRRDGMLVRMSEIEIFPKDLARYKAVLKKEAAASVRLEPGVVAIFPMSERERPAQIRILEIYASRGAYESHLKTPHFQEYKTTTLKMVKSLRLVDMETLDAGTMGRIFKKMETKSISRALDTGGPGGSGVRHQTLPSGTLP